MGIRRAITALAAAALLGGAALAAAPAASAAGGTLVDNHNGTVTLTYDSTGVLNWGLYLCRGSVAGADCNGNDFVSIIFLRNRNTTPPLQDSPVLIEAGMIMDIIVDGTNSGTEGPLPSGYYSMQFWQDDWHSSGVANLTNVCIGNCNAPGRDLTVWTQQIGRASAEEACPANYKPSWAQWPNGGKGGWICNRDVYAYYPDEEVK